MADILRFPFEPFVWLWTALVVGFLIALPDRLTKVITHRDNIGAYVIVAGSLLALMLTGIVDFDAIRRAGPLVNVLKYILHPLTIGWTLIIIGIVIALPDNLTDRILSQDKFGYIVMVVAALALVLGIGLIRLDQFVSYQLFLGIAIGVVLTLGLQHYVRRARTTQGDAPVVSRVVIRAATPAQTESTEEDEDIVFDDDEEEPARSDLPQPPTA
jgi:hypothetical protein